MSFRNYLIKKGLSRSNQEALLNWQHNFEAWILGRNKLVNQLTTRDLIEYLQVEKGHLQRSSLETLLNKIKHYFAYQKLDNPLEDFSLAQKWQPKNYHYLKAQELEEMEELIRLRPRMKLDNKLIFSLLVYQGLATFELASLRVYQLDFEAAKLHLADSKLAGRSIPLQAVQIPMLIGFVADKEPQDLLFNLNPIRKLHNKCDALKKQVKRVLKAEKRPIIFDNLQQIRASRIALWIGSEGILRAQYLAGHYRLSSTQRFETPATEQLRQGLLQAHPMFKP